MSTDADYWKQEALLARDELRRLQQAHALLLHREWFAVTCEDPVVGRGIADEQGRYTLYFCTRAGTFPCCSLGPKDVLLVGRYNGEPEREAALAALADGDRTEG